MLGRTVPDWLETAHLGIPSGVEVGVVAGTAAFGLGRIVVPNLPRPHGGVIRVEETAVEGMKDCALVPVSHSHMLLSGLVGRLVCRFLLDGCFESRAVLPEEARA